MATPAFATLTTGAASSSFDVPYASDLTVTMIGTFNSALVSLQVSPDNSTFTALSSDGVASTFSTSGEQRLFRLQPGLYYRFSAGAVTSVAIYKNLSAAR